MSLYVLLGTPPDKVTPGVIIFVLIPYQLALHFPAVTNIEWKIVWVSNLSNLHPEKKEMFMQ